MKIAICFFGILGGIEGKNGKGASKPIIEISKKYYNQKYFYRRYRCFYAYLV